MATFTIARFLFLLSAVHHGQSLTIINAIITLHCSYLVCW